MEESRCQGPDSLRNFTASRNQSGNETLREGLRTVRPKAELSPTTASESVKGNTVRCTEYRREWEQHKNSTDMHNGGQSANKV
ncbi:hypothetical protein EOD39_6653 [Acipenser ruthenus]|uniref:Uncharacterized protein n=1 Tax=Acipenser ruthenus TaxID=7906 RepID=A0A444U9H3_ACIRT|nr:hypothetical protein EOD39_6653 [Acipenser ruthenus]